MIKNWKKATLLGILVWILIFVAYTIIMFIPGVGQNAKYIMLAGSPLLVLLCGYFYFSKVEGKAAEGLALGFYWLIVGAVLDLIITVPLFVKSYSLYYGDLILWLSFALSLVAAIISSLIFKKKI